MSNIKALNREILSRFLPTHEAVRAFEKILQSVDLEIPESIADLLQSDEENLILGQTALTRAIQANDSLLRIAQALEILASAPIASQLGNMSEQQYDHVWVKGFDRLYSNPNSLGNISREVMSTQIGGLANQWAQLATFNIGDPAANSTFNGRYLVIGRNSFDAPLAEITVRIRAAGGSYSTFYTQIDVHNIYDTTGLNFDDFKLTADATTAGSDLNLWVQRALNNEGFHLVEVQRVSDYVGDTVTYTDDSTWSGTVPTGSALNFTSDWAGSRQQNSTSFSSGWAGTGYYEKTDDGLVLLSFDFTTVGTVTDGTTLFTVPADFRPGIVVPAAFLATASGGYLLLDTAGAVKCYSISGTPSSGVSSQFAYRARN